MRAKLHLDTSSVDSRYKIRQEDCNILVHTGCPKCSGTPDLVKSEERYNFVNKNIVEKGCNFHRAFSVVEKMSRLTVTVLRGNEHFSLRTAR